MPMPDKTSEQCQELLAPGTTVEHVLPGTMVMSAGVGQSAMNVVLVITPAEIVVFRVGLVRRYKPEQIWSRIARRAPITVERSGSLATCTIGTLQVEIDDEDLPVLHRAGLDIRSS